MRRRFPIVLAAAGTVLGLLGTAAFGQPRPTSYAPAAEQAAAEAFAATQRRARGPRGKRGPRGLRGLRGLRGTPGAAGATGPTGAQGPAGPAGAAGANGQNGAPGAPGLSGVEIIQALGTTVITTGLQDGTATASCPAGKKVLGGGGEFVPIAGVLLDGPFLLASKPVATEPQGWTMTLRANMTDDWAVRAWAICANAT